MFLNALPGSVLFQKNSKATLQNATTSKRPTTKPISLKTLISNESTESTLTTPHIALRNSPPVNWQESVVITLKTSRELSSRLTLSMTSWWETWNDTSNQSWPLWPQTNEQNWSQMKLRLIILNEKTNCKSLFFESLSVITLPLESLQSWTRKRESDEAKSCH